MLFWRKQSVQKKDKGWNSIGACQRSPNFKLPPCICRQTPTTHVIYICEPLQVISVKVQVITPWWWILYDPKRVGVIFNYVSFKLLYDIDFSICCQTPTTHVINICEPLRLISVKVQVITPWWWILCDPKHVGVIFNYVSFKLLYDIDFSI